MSAPVFLLQDQNRSDFFPLAPVLWVQIKPPLTDSRGTMGLLTLSGSCRYSLSSLGIGSPRRPASKLLAANKDMVFRVP